MGCTKFAELWDKGLDDLIVDASTEAFDSAGVSKEDVDAYWFGTAQSGMSGITLARPLQLRNKPVTRVENYCTTGSEALRGAVYAVASGAYDVAMAVGAEKVKDSGFQGLNAMNPPGDGTARTLTAAAMFSMVAPAYGQKYGVDEETMADVLASIAVKNHYNGARNPRAQFRREITKEQALGSPRLAGTLGVFDCAGVADGAAAAIVVRAEDALKYTDKPIYIKALSFAAGSGSGLIDPGYDYTHFPECEAAAADAYAQAGITDPRRQLAMAEVHDCFTPTELVLMEDLGFAPRGTAWKEVLAGTFDLDGDLPDQPRRRVEVVRAPGGRFRSAHVLRVLAADARRGAGGPPDRHHRPRPRHDPQPRGLPGGDGVVRLGGRLAARLSQSGCGRHSLTAPASANSTSGSRRRLTSTGRCARHQRRDRVRHVPGVHGHARDQPAVLQPEGDEFPVGRLPPEHARGPSRGRSPSTPCPRRTGRRRSTGSVRTGVGDAQHVLGRDRTLIQRGGPVLQPDARLEERVPRAGDVPGGEDIRGARAQELVGGDAVLERRAGVFRERDPRHHAHADDEHVAAAGHVPSAKRTSSARAGPRSSSTPVPRCHSTPCSAWTSL